MNNISGTAIIHRNLWPIYDIKLMWYYCECEIFTVRIHTILNIQTMAQKCAHYVNKIWIYTNVVLKCVCLGSVCWIFYLLLCYLLWWRWRSMTKKHRRISSNPALLSFANRDSNNIQTVRLMFNWKASLSQSIYLQTHRFIKKETSFVQRFTSSCSVFEDGEVFQSYFGERSNR